MKKTIGCAVFLMLVATAAGASAVIPVETFKLPIEPILPIAQCKAPEIDPASAMSALTMLAAGVAVLRGRGRGRGLGLKHS